MRAALRSVRADRGPGAAITAAVTTGIVVGVELIGLALRRAQQIDSSRTGDAPVAIVVLGFPGHVAAARAVQRWRIAMAVRACRRHPGASVVVTGGCTRGAVSEATEMADIAVRAGVPPDALVLEERATTTWENVMFTRPLVDPAATVVIVSDAVHATRARRYWLQQFPEDRGRVAIDPAHRPFDRVWLGVPSALAHALRSVAIRLRR